MIGCAGYPRPVPHWSADWTAWLAQRRCPEVNRHPYSFQATLRQIAGPGYGKSELQRSDWERRNARQSGAGENMDTNTLIILVVVLLLVLGGGGFFYRRRA